MRLVGWPWPGERPHVLLMPCRPDCIAPAHGDNGVMIQRGILSRMTIVGLLALGLVGMHHLAVAACHHAVTHTSHIAPLADTVTPSHVGHGTAPVAPMGSPEQAPSDRLPGGLVGAAATCLAILLMVVGLVLPQIAARLRRWWATIARLRLVDAPSLALRPPDLTLLSVSRT